jgi:hypoxanthine phosphoribosyltransferase
MNIDYTTTVSLCRIITEKATQTPTHIAAINRGGLIVGLTLSHHWEIPLITIQNNDEKSLNQIKEILENGDATHVLLVDDYCDTGYTISEITNHLFRYSDPSKITTAVLCAKKKSADLVDICAEVIENEEKIKTFTEFTF